MEEAPPPSPPASPPRRACPFELDDLIQHPNPPTLAFITRLHDTDPSTSSDTSSETSTDPRGRLIRWFNPPSSPTSIPSKNSTPLISSYDDTNTPAADAHQHEQRHDGSLAKEGVSEGFALVTDALSGVTSVRNVADMHIVDRCFEPASIVSHISSHRAATVVDVRKKLVVRRVKDVPPASPHITNAESTFEVDASELGFFIGIRAGDFVVRGECVGVVDYFQEDVYVQFSDGAIACIPGHSKALRNVDSRTPTRKEDPFAEGLYFPGQKVSSIPEVWMNVATWIRGAYSGSDEGVVKKVMVGDVGVEWLAKSLYAGGGESVPGVDVVKFSEIALLQAFRGGWWTVGDRGYLVSHEELADDVEDGEEENGKEGRLTRAHRRARARGGDAAVNLSEVCVSGEAVEPEDVVQIVRTRTCVDVLWQDGRLEVGVEATEFRRNEHPDGYDFFPGEIVMRSEGGSVLRGGVVRVDAERRTAVVKWQTEVDGDFLRQEEVSVYELKADEYDVSIGDTVLHVPQNGKSPGWVGVVLKHSMGVCTVSWYAGGVSDVKLSELVFIQGEEEDEEESYESGSDAEWRYGADDEEMVDNWGSDEEEGNQTEEYVEGRRMITRLVNGLFGRERAFAIEGAEAAVTESIRVAVETSVEWLEERRRKIGEANGQDGGLGKFSVNEAKLLGRLLASRASAELLGRTLVCGREAGDAGADVLFRFCHALGAAFNSLLAREIGGAGSESPGDRTIAEAAVALCANGVGEDDDEEGMAMECSTDEEEGVARFGVVDEGFDGFHSFPQASSSGATMGFLNVINREWKRLQKCLPPGIYVRGCEHARDRVRAAIVGPADTPYADVLFFFDILLPGKYPLDPPHVHFWSFGRRLNPNLYEDGKVCLSILGTWDGDDVESWDAKTSNLLRVLLSLQAMVFVSEPYFNEAGYAKQRGTREGRANSAVYNEGAVLGCLRHVMSTLAEGGVKKEWIVLAHEHYGRRGKAIVNRCEDIVRGECGSEGFRRSVANILAGVEEALAGVAANGTA